MAGAVTLGDSVFVVDSDYKRHERGETAEAKLFQHNNGDVTQISLQSPLQVSEKPAMSLRIHIQIAATIVSHEQLSVFRATTGHLRSTAAALACLCLL